MKNMKIYSILLLFIITSGTAGQVFSQQNLLAKFNEKQPTGKSVRWDGDWNLASRFYPQSLKIKAVSAKSFSFTLSSSNGANQGEISGTAEIKGSKAFFDDRKIKPKDSEPYGCQLLFVNNGNSIETQTSPECSSYGGNGVGFEGTLTKGKTPVIENNFVKLDVFPNIALDRKFKELTGKDYETFLNSFHLIYDEPDLDGLDAKAFSACVRGICPYMAGIIMYDKKGTMWAAVIQSSDDSDKTVINYYTNDAARTDKLPKTIENWANEKKELNKNVTIVYKSKK